VETPREPPTAPVWARITLVAMTAAAAWLRLPGLTAEEPWFDEVFSIVLASQDLPELWHRSVADQTNPPGFYLLLWGWTRLGGFDLAWMRLLPLLAAVLTVPAMALAARASGLGWSGAIVGAALAAASPLMFAMASELRAYAPLALATSLTLAAAAQRRTVATAIGGLGLVSLHYFGAFVVAALALAALREDRGRWREAVTAALPAGVALAAWLLVVVRAADAGGFAGNAAWIAPSGARALLSFGSQVVGTFGTTTGAVVVLALLIIALAAALRPAARGTSAASAAGPAVGLEPAIALAIVPLVLVALLAAATGRELWVARYLIITLPGWWLLLAHVVERTPGQWREAALAALLTWSSLAGIHADRARTRKTHWSLVARALTAGGPRTICTNESFVALPLRYQALGRGIPLTVLDLADCSPSRTPTAMLMRPGTEAALTQVERAGARVGPARTLGTTLPATTLVPLEWRPR
jgi:uncharacterized membrane protein